jgi:hypothetical protein
MQMISVETGTRFSDQLEGTCQRPLTGASALKIWSAPAQGSDCAKARRTMIKTKADETVSIMHSALLALLIF